MKLEQSFDSTIKELESKLSESDIKTCQETAKLSASYTNITYRGSYITAMLQKIQLNTKGNLE